MVFCFVVMSNGVNLMDGLDGLVVGMLVVVYIGMVIVVFFIYFGNGFVILLYICCCCNFLEVEKLNEVLFFLYFFKFLKYM